MSDFSKLNGYDVKDAQARQDLEQLTNIVSGHSDRLSNVETNINLINSERTILIGDSYALDRRPDIDITGWGVPLREMLELSDSDCYIIQDNGGGFIANGSLGTFENAITNANITDKNTIKRIVVCGGLNDKESTKDTIKNAIISFITYCKTNFPNANVYLGMIGWVSNDYPNDGQLTRYKCVNNVLSAFQESSEYGAIYLNGVENVMHDYSEYYDSSHPNQVLCERLAYYIYQSLKTGLCNVTYSEHKITFNQDYISVTNSTLSEKIVNNNTILFDYSENGSNIEFSSNYPTTDSNNNFYLGKIESKYIRNVYNDFNIATCEAIITDTSNTTYKVGVVLSIRNFDYLHVHITDRNITAGLSIKKITLLHPYSVKPTIMQ